MPDTEYESGLNVFLRGLSPEDTRALSMIDHEGFFEFFLLLRAAAAADSAIAVPSDDLVIHLYKTCQLNCNYCIVDQTTPSTEKVKIEDVRELAAKLPLRKVKFIGGEPTLNWGLIYQCLDAVGHVEEVSITTNGLGLTRECMAELKARSSRQSYRLSLEPTSWKNRVFRDGSTHQNDKLRGVLREIDVEKMLRDRGSYINIVLPSTAPTETASVDAIVDEVSGLLGTTAWRGRWIAETPMCGTPSPAYLQWIAALTKEEYFSYRDGAMSKERFEAGPLGYLCRWATRSGYGYTVPGKFFTCTVGGRSINLSYDGTLYGCAVEAGRASGTATPIPVYDVRSRWDMARRVLPALQHRECRTCPARFWCGKTCGTPEATYCENTRLRVRLLPEVLALSDPVEFVAVQARQLRLVRFYQTHLDGIKRMLAANDVQEFIAGRVSDVEVAKKALSALQPLLRKA